jgi:hypothetical protein
VIGISERSLYGLWARGCGPPFYHAGRSRLVNREALDEWPGKVRAGLITLPPRPPRAKELERKRKGAA